MPAAARVKLLLLEDDPISRAFLSEALSAMPASVDCADTCSGAESLARGGAYALWLFDANLPDGSGADLLRRLRAAGLTTKAIALTAESCRDRLDALSAAGFSRVLQKPISATALLSALGRSVGGIDSADSMTVELPILWDEGRALSAVGGKAESARALRMMFLEELPGQVEGVANAFAASDHAAVRDHLHRLKASCGFVGAERLLSAVQRLSSEMSEASLDDFRRVAGIQRQHPPVMPDAV